MEKLFLTEFNQDEYWYGGIVSAGDIFPLSDKDECDFDLTVNTTVNQMTTVFLSTKGRVIACRHGFKIYFKHGSIYIDDAAPAKDIKLLQAEQQTLKSAYYLAMQQYFPFDENDKIPPQMYEAPQFNTWIQMLYEQNQQDVLSYADTIIREGYEPGVLMIDDGWSPYYGKWVFDKAKFDDPAAMVSELHRKGFKVMLWVCPHISPDSEIFRLLEKKDCLVKNADGTTAIRQWWNGYSAILDLSNPDAVRWIKQQLDNLVNTCGIDGFKFDAGDARFYREDDKTHGNVSPNEQSRLWADFGRNYSFNELRAAVNNGGRVLCQRLADKDHSWGKGGIASLIPHSLIQSLFGYPYNCPDMIGGGEYLNFLSNKHNLDPDLFVRHAQISCLMPMMQFSAAPWRFLPDRQQRACLDAAKLRDKLLPVIRHLFQNSYKDGTPITAPLEFYFPNQNLQYVKQEFMLGDKYLVAPITQKDIKTHRVTLPQGIWKDLAGNIVKGGTAIEIKADTETIPVYERVL